MMRRDVIVVGASAGGVRALTTLIGGLPADLPAAVFVVLHVAPTTKSELEHILQRHSRLPVTTPVDGATVEPGKVYVATADHHLLLQEERIRVVRGPKENRARPAIDALFRSAASAAGPRVIGVVLTGMLDDGTAGLWAIKHRGGTAIVQDPKDAEFPSMPENALRYVDADHVLPVGEIAPRITELVGRPVNGEVAEPPSRALLDLETAVARGEAGGRNTEVLALGTPTPFTCPDCHGVLVKLNDGGVPRFRCHTGHAFSAGALLSALTEDIQVSFAHFAREVDESALLLDHLAAHLRDSGEESSAVELEQHAKDTRRRGTLLRDVMKTHEVMTPQHPIVAKATAE